MKLQGVVREVESSGQLGKATFGISSKRADQRYLMLVLRDKLYTNKVLAVLREYSANAWDAHIDAGKPDLPIKVTLPTELESSVVIRDFGKGLTGDYVYHHYTQYGDSDKRDNNDGVGSFGLGCKVGFAYNDTFSVTSWHNGIKTVYIAVLGDEEDDMQKMYEEPCGEETGIEVKIPVKPGDIPRFIQEAQKLFPFFEPLPDINLPLTTAIEDRTAAGFFTKRQQWNLPDWVAVMGCVPYTLDWSTVTAEVEAAGLSGLVGRMKGGLYFDIGDVDIPPNRESLEYTDRTRLAIVERLKLLTQSVKEQGSTILKDSQRSFWQRRIDLQELADSTGFNFGFLGDDRGRRYASYGGFTVSLYSSSPVTGLSSKEPVLVGDKAVYDSPTSFSVVRMVKEYTSRSHKWDRRVDANITIGEATLVYVDTNKHLGGYEAHRTVYRFVVPRNGFTREQVLAELSLYLDRAAITGVPIVDASTLHHSPVTPPASVNPKYRQKWFVLKLSGWGRGTSEDWNVSSTEPGPDDPYVILYRFKAVKGSPGGGNTRRYVKSVNDTLNRVFKIALPPVYGVKTSKKKPVKAKDVDSVLLDDWVRKKVRELLLSKEHEAVLTRIQVKYWSDCTDTSNKTAKALLEVLDGRHRIARFLKKLLKMRAAHKPNMSYRHRKDLEWLERQLGRDKPWEAPEKLLAGISGTYPLLSLGSIDKDNINNYVEYIELIDKRDNRKTR